MPYKNPIKQKEAQHLSYLKNKDKYKKKIIDRVHNNKDFLFSIKDQMFCSMCGENDLICLDFHHKDPLSKDKNVSYLIRHASLEKLKTEIEKCKILCSNCHRKHHFKNPKYPGKSKAKVNFINKYKLEHPCKCGENHISCLEFHHLRDKIIEVSLALKKGWSISQLEKEIEKCEVLCSNCHRKLHRDIKKMPQ